MRTSTTFFLLALTAAALALAALPADARAQTCGGVPPNMLIVQDLSGSMDDTVGSTTKWAAAKAAVKTMTDKYAAGGIRFGLELFADPDQSDYCTATKIHVGVADNNAAAIQSKMNGESPWSSTPLKGALDTANGYAGLKDATRPNYVLLITDGQETCAMAANGVDYDTTACIQSIKNLRASNIKTFVVGFGSGVDAGVLNSAATEGGTAKAASPYYYQADNQADLQTALDTIAAIVAAGPCTVPGKLGLCAIGEKECVGGQVNCKQITFPGTEVCDGKDNDCDGNVDNGLAPRACSTACGSGTETCTGGLWLGCTAPKPQTEVCDGKDNNCNGQVDENDPGGGGQCTVPGQKGECAKGTTHCVNGVLACVQNRQPTAEICDGFDNDCDGVVDNGLTRPCSNKCGTGTETCAAGKWVNCNVKQPSVELCNGLDDDCDGVIDNGDPGGGKSCQVPAGSGACGVGTTHCVNGKIECVANETPKAEECNGLDDDCDGVIDNGNPGGGQPCATGKPGICAVGTTQCKDGKLECIPDRQPEPEVCDGIDNNCDGRVDEGVRNACGLCGDVPREICNGIDDDCDGVIDNGATCDDPSKTCVNGECVGRCVNNECPVGTVCKTGKDGSPYCLSPCNGVTCPPGQKCDESSGSCYDPCAAVTCAAGKRCMDGACVAEDCHESGCPERMICVEGACQNDPCAGVVCPVSSACQGGACVPSCAGIACAIGKSCEAGQCKDDPCSYISCPQGKHCEVGQCVDDPCAQKTCGKGYVCVDASCEDDPCLSVRCANGQVCRDGQCYFDNTPAQDGGYGSDDDGGSGGDGAVEGDAGGGGTGDLDAGDNGGSGGGTQGGGKKPNVTAADTPSGCSCSVADTGPGAGGLLAFLGLALAVLFLRRRG